MEVFASYALSSTLTGWHPSSARKCSTKSRGLVPKLWSWTKEKPSSRKSWLRSNFLVNLLFPFFLLPVCYRKIMHHKSRVDDIPHLKNAVLWISEGPPSVRADRCLLVAISQCYCELDNSAAALWFCLEPLSSAADFRGLASLSSASLGAVIGYASHRKRGDRCRAGAGKLLPKHGQISWLALAGEHERLMFGDEFWLQHQGIVARHFKPYGNGVRNNQRWKSYQLQHQVEALWRLGEEIDGGRCFPCFWDVFLLFFQKSRCSCNRTGRN